MKINIERILFLIFIFSNINTYATETRMLRYPDIIIKPDGGLFGNKVCITNEWTESGGENFTSIFRLTQSGLLIGESTYGNLAYAKDYEVIRLGDWKKV